MIRKKETRRTFSLISGNMSILSTLPVKFKIALTVEKPLYTTARMNESTVAERSCTHVDRHCSTAAGKKKNWLTLLLVCTLERKRGGRGERRVTTCGRLRFSLFLSLPRCFLFAWCLAGLRRFAGSYNELDFFACILWCRVLCWFYKSSVVPARSEGIKELSKDGTNEKPCQNFFLLWYHQKNNW